MMALLGEEVDGRGDVLLEARCVTLPFSNRRCRPKAELSDISRSGRA